MFKSAQVLASTTLLCCVLALSGCGASQAGQEAEGTSAQPSASASVKPGTIRVASDGATPFCVSGLHYRGELPRCGAPRFFL